nr:hypothetical protein Itr_chr03CG04360 [Ipomoea trifida]
MTLWPLDSLRRLRPLSDKGGMRDWELDASSRAAYSRTANECTRADRPRVDSISALTLRRRPVDAAARIRSRFPLDEGLGLSAFIKVIRLPSIRSSFHLKDGWLHYPSPLFESMTANGIPNFGPRVFCHFPCKHREQRHFFQGFLTGRLPYERLLLMLLDNAHTVSSSSSASTGTFTPQPLPHSRELVTISKEELESLRRLMAQLEGPYTTSTFAYSSTSASA